MSINDYVNQIFPVKCKGRNEEGLEVLEGAIEVNVEIHKRPGSSIISSNINCPYNTGGHGQRCNASHPDKDKVREGIICPYSFDIPYALEKR